MLLKLKLEKISNGGNSDNSFILAGKIQFNFYIILRSCKNQVEFFKWKLTFYCIVLYYRHVYNIHMFFFIKNFLSYKFSMFNLLLPLPLLDVLCAIFKH